MVNLQLGIEAIQESGQPAGAVFQVAFGHRVTGLQQSQERDAEVPGPGVAAPSSSVGLGMA
jgi:hypothetical protein